MIASVTIAIIIIIIIICLVTTMTRNAQKAHSLWEYILITITTKLKLLTCRKQQKLSERKVSWFTRFHPNVGKTFVAFALSVLKVLPLLKAFVGKTFAFHRKSTKAFLSHSLNAQKTKQNRNTQNN